MTLKLPQLDEKPSYEDLLNEYLVKYYETYLNQVNPHVVPEAREFSNKMVRQLGCRLTSAAHLQEPTE
jgi:hypothetical protein